MLQRMYWVLPLICDFSCAAVRHAFPTDSSSIGILVTLPLICSLMRSALLPEYCSTASRLFLRLRLVMVGMVMTFRPFLEILEFLSRNWTPLHRTWVGTNVTLSAFWNLCVNYNFLSRICNCPNYWRVLSTRTSPVVSWTEFHPS